MRALQVGNNAVAQIIIEAAHLKSDLIKQKWISIVSTNLSPLRPVNFLLLFLRIEIKAHWFYISKTRPSPILGNVLTLK